MIVKSSLGAKSIPEQPRISRFDQKLSGQLASALTMFKPKCLHMLCMSG